MFKFSIVDFVFLEFIIVLIQRAQSEAVITSP